MRLVADTNCVVSGLLWHGPPYKLLRFAQAGRITLYTTSALLLELARVLEHRKLSHVLAARGLSPEEVFQHYVRSVSLVLPVEIGPVVRADPADDAVLGCAVACQAQAIVSGDRHLLELKSFRDIPILRPAELVARLQP